MITSQRLWLLWLKVSELSQKYSSVQGECVCLLGESAVKVGEERGDERRMRMVGHYRRICKRCKRLEAQWNAAECWSMSGFTTHTTTVKLLHCMTKRMCIWTITPISVYSPKPLPHLNRPQFIPVCCNIIISYTLRDPNPASASQCPSSMKTWCV